MPTFKLTKSQLDQLCVRPKAYIAYDDSLPGFGCRVTPNGVKSWIIEFREGAGGRRAAKRRMTLGPVSVIPPVMARKQAHELLALARLGNDVAGGRAKKRAEPQLQELVADYTKVELSLKKASTAKNYASLFGKHLLPEFGKSRASEVTTADVRRLHRQIGVTHPVTANRVLVLLSGLYSWAEGEGRIATGLNPVRKISKYPEKNRERFLTVDELTRLGAALREAETVGLHWELDPKKPLSKHMPKEGNRVTIFSTHAIAAIRLLLFTGCRLREILHLRWEEYDPERGLLFLADSKTGRKTVVLSEAAIGLPGLSKHGTELLADLMTKDGMFGFSYRFELRQTRAGRPSDPLERSARNFMIENYVISYKQEHGCGQDAAVAAAEQKFNVTRGTVYRAIKDQQYR